MVAGKALQAMDDAGGGRCGGSTTTVAAAFGGGAWGFGGWVSIICIDEASCC